MDSRRIEIDVYVDGGCKANGRPEAKMYTSMAVYHQGAPVREIRHAYEDFAHMTPQTNQHAELLALRVAVEYLLGLQRRLGPEFCLEATVYTDSTLTVEFANWKLTKPWLQQQKTLIKDGESTLRSPLKIVRIPRDEIVAILGH